MLTVPTIVLNLLLKIKDFVVGSTQAENLSDAHKQTAIDAIVQAKAMVQMQHEKRSILSALESIMVKISSSQITEIIRPSAKIYSVPTRG